MWKRGSEKISSIRIFCVILFGCLLFFLELTLRLLVNTE
jgi:hypothetical protein